MSLFLDLVKQTGPRQKPSFVLSEHACLVHGDPFRASRCERVRGLPCPVCEREPVFIVASVNVQACLNLQPSMRKRRFEKREVEWAIEGARGCALAWSEVL